MVTNETTSENNYMFGSATTELDEPLDSGETADNVTFQDSLSVKRLEREEKDKERKEKRYFSAFYLILGCLIFLGAVYIIDVICSWKLTGELSSITESIVEIIKTLLFTLSGYLFGKRESND